MNIALIDADGTRFPNLALMKLSSAHKALGDHVEWHVPGKHYDRAYVSKIFTESPAYDAPILADNIVRGGTGHGLKNKLPKTVEQMCPDYSLYPQYHEAYGFLTRGCPRACPFCIVSKKEGRASRQVGDLDGFHRGQRVIKLLDPNLLACPDRERLLLQLATSGAAVDFTQGLDIRLCKDIMPLLRDIKIKMLHFAWDNPREDLTRHFSSFASHDERNCRQRRVYVLVNYWSTPAEDMWRIETLVSNGFDPYVMLYDKHKFVDARGRWLPGAQERYTPETLRHFKLCQHLQRWCNHKAIFRTVSFEQYLSGKRGFEDV
jgi:hypothetical protein